MAANFQISETQFIISEIPKESKHSQRQKRVSEIGKVTCAVLPALKNWLTELVPRKRMQGRRLIAGRLVDVELTSLPSR